MAFAFFDRDKNGDISKSEMKLRVMQIFKEHVSLEKSVRHSSQALVKLDYIFSFVTIIVLLFISMVLWGVDSKEQLAGILSIWAALIFASKLYSVKLTL